MTIKELQSIIKDIEHSPLMTLELEMDDFKLKLSKNKFEPTSEKAKEVEVKQPQPSITEIKEEIKKNGNEVKSPLVGTFYQSPTINGNPYVEIGQTVKKGQVLCIIEAMKIMNEITSPFDGVLKDVLISNGSVVGFDQVIMVIE